MAVKSILDIDMKDGKFREFAALFDRYNAALKKMPDAWKLVTDKIDGSKAAYDKLVDSMVAGNIQQKLREKAQERANELTRTAADRWKDMARSTKDVAGNIKDGTIQLLKWSGVVGVVTGLLGAGGIWGIDRMAASVASGRRSSLGLGLGYGEQASFGANFSRLVDPESFLSAVSTAKFDITQRTGLLGAGLSQRDIGGNTAQTAVALLQNLKRIADTTNPALFGQVISARRLGQFTSPQDLERLRNTSTTEFAQLLAGFSRNAGKNNLPPDVLKAYQDLSTQLSNAGNSIFNTFVRGLAPLAPGLTKLSEGVERLVGAALGSPTLARWIGEVEKGLEKFAGYIGTPDFEEKVRGFVNGIGIIGSKLAWLASWIPGGGSGAGGYSAHIADRLSGTNRRRIARGEDIQNPAMNWLMRPWGPPKIPISGDPMTDLLALVRQDETRGRPGMAHAVSPYGAEGLYQILPGTAKQYGRDPTRLQDVAYNEGTARIILADLMKRYHGNLDRVLAAYHGGRGRGDDMKLGPYGRDYLAYARNVQGYDKVKIEISNTTGGNANVSVNGLKN